MPTIAFINNIFGIDGLVVLIIGLLIFGRRLPDIGRNFGQTIVEFKHGLNQSTDSPRPPTAEDLMWFLVPLFYALIVFEWLRTCN